MSDQGVEQCLGSGAAHCVGGNIHVNQPFCVKRLYCIIIASLSPGPDPYFMTQSNSSWHTVRASGLHGTGVYAAKDFPAGTRIIGYGGRRITPEQADAMHPVNPDDPFHTFFFAISSGKVIDGGNRRNDARWRSEEH